MENLCAALSAATSSTASAGNVACVCTTRGPQARHVLDALVAADPEK